MNVKQSRHGFTLVELMVTVSIIGILASIAIVGYVKWVDNAKLSKAETFLATVRTQQLAYKNRFSTFVTAGANPSTAPSTGAYLESWDGTDTDWIQLGANPGRDKVEFQYQTSGGGGTCVPKSGYPATCSGVSGGKWFWATAENSDWVLISNSAKPHVWRVEK